MNELATANDCSQSTTSASGTERHEVKESYEVDVWYPGHEPRKTSSTFRHTVKHLIKELDTPCWLCGSKVDRECHHFYIEWAYSNAIDWDKVKADHPTFDWASFKDAEDFVDSPYNMKVLCQTHHRGKNHGIHNVPYPIWQVQKYIKDDFKMFSAVHGGDPDAGELPDMILNFAQEQN